MVQATLIFDGPDLTAQDTQRLGRQLDKVRQLLLDGRWRSLREISEVCQCSESSASARIRDCRKSRNGGYTVERRRRAESIWEYRIALDQKQGS